jgi:hypothetical protein
MSEYAQYYEAFTARLASPEGLSPEDCRCHGGGWILSDVDTWHQCPDHFAGQLHPEDFDPYRDLSPEDLAELTAALDAAAEPAAAAPLICVFDPEFDPNNPDHIPF